MAKYDLQSFVGTEIVEKRAINTGISGNIYKKCKWTVIEAHPYFIRVMRICENGTEIYNTFNIGDLVRMGVINDKRRMTNEG